MNYVLILNIILVHIVLSFLGKFIDLYVPFLSENPIIETLHMNQRKIVTTSVITSGIVYLGMILYEKRL